MAKPVSYAKFVAQVAPTLMLTLAQVVLALVSFDAVDPSVLDAAQRALAEKLFGAVEGVPTVARTVVAWVKGARIGGTLLCSLRLLHLALTVGLPMLAVGEVACALIVGPDLRLARQALRYALGAAKAHPKIRIESEREDSFVIVRPDGKRVSIECLPATRGGSAVRGRTLVAALLTEASFFRDDNYVVNDVELFRAILPRIVRGGQVLVESTPFAELGLLYELHQKNFGDPKTALVAEAPTLLMRDDEITASIVAGERDRDPVNAAREHDCKFMSAGAGVFFDPKLVDDSVDENLPHPGQHDPLAGRATGADFGFVHDSSALTILEARGSMSTLVVADEVRPTPGYPLRPSEVAKQFAQTMQRYGSRSMCTDGHYIESIREHVEPFGIRLIRSPDGQVGKLEAFLAARQLFADRRVRIPPLPRLVAQIKSVISRPTPGGGLSISIPRRRGMAHGDLCSAFVLSCWLVKSSEVAERSAQAWTAKVERFLHATDVIAGIPSAVAKQAQIDADRMARARAQTIHNPTWHERAAKEWAEECKRSRRVAWPAPKKEYQW